MAAPARGDVLGTLDWLAALSDVTSLSSDEEDFVPDFSAGWDEDPGDALAEIEQGCADSGGEEEQQGPRATAATTTTADTAAASSPPADSPQQPELQQPELLRNGVVPDFDRVHGYISDDGDEDDDGNADV